MECVSRFTAVRPFIASPINLRRSVPRRVSMEPLRSSHDIHLIKPKIRERRRKEWWRWALLLDPDNPISDGDRDPMRDEEENLSSDEEELAEELEKMEEELAEEMEERAEELAEELLEMEEEAMDGQDGGRQPSDYDRRAQIFDESSRVFTSLKEKKDDSANEGDDNSS